MRVAADTVQLVLPGLGGAPADERWWSLPAAVRSEVLTLLARLIARGVLIDADAGEGGGGDE